tara:strand:+ start:2290 stop:2550 length:261 start_codon:yes stop_codon:yes gene_type:complete
MDDIFDFGFTAVTEDELSTVKEANETAIALSEQTDNKQNQLDSLFNAIVPLLNNLKMNPEKEYILWPDRLAKVEQFEDMLQKIYKG